MTSHESCLNVHVIDEKHRTVMNLSALNTGPTQAPISSATEASTSLAGQQRAPAGTLSGEDFASFLRNQIRALKNNERQDIAAAPQPPASPRAEHLTPYRATHEAMQEAADEADRRPSKPVKAKESAQTDQTNSAHNTNKQALSETSKQPQTASDADELDTRNQVQANKPDDAPTPSTEADARVAEQPMPSSDAAQSAPPLTDATLAASPAELTTIPLSASINIITTAQTQPSDKSVADFALAMGLDPSQVQALFGQSATSTSPSGNVSTQQVLAMNSLSSVNAPAMPKDLGLSTISTPTDSLNLAAAVSTADFQALKASDTATLDASANSTMNALSNLNIQIATAQVTQTATPAMPVSTLAVLSMMDTELRAEDIDALKTEFDALSPTEAGGTGAGQHSLNASATHANLPAKATTVLANNPNMAQTFDKLSEKLATELASRMNDQLNAGEWKMKFALKPASLGLVDVQLEMRDGRLTAQFNADTNLTQDLIQNGSQRLKEALAQLGMNNASVLVGQGQTQQQSQSGQSGQSGFPSQRDDNRVKLADEAGPELAASARPRHSNSLQFDNYA